MKFLHALVSNLLQSWRKIAVFTVDDKIDRSLCVFQEENETSNVDRMACTRQRQADP
jgi:hypothetical protein